MLRLTCLALLLLLGPGCSASLLKKSLVRRQSDAQPCQALEGFECKCSYYRVTCTTEQELPASLTVSPHEQHKYQSVELVVAAPREISVNEQSFAPAKQLFKPDGDNLEFRVKFEKFTALYLNSPGLLNRVFPENLPSGARKHVALEIYNPEVQPHDNVNLFQNLHVESLELYALYPFRGSFQQLFNGANINYLRLSGGDIRSDAAQPFTGNIARLELAKQASALTVQNFPVYPAHEQTINAFYISDFDAPHPPNYNNLGELRVHSQQAIPANAFRNFPNIHTLVLSSDQAIDPQALNGLSNLEKLTIKDSKVNLALLNALPNLKEFETNVEKLDEKTQCQLLEKLASGKLALQALPNGRECTCVAAYLDAAAGRTPCDAQGCERASCAAIKNNYDPNTRTFKAPPAILRADGSNALQQRPARVYQSPFQISQQDQQKLQQGAPPPPPPPPAQPGDQPQDQYPPQDTSEQRVPPGYPGYGPARTDDEEPGEDEEEEQQQQPTPSTPPSDGQGQPPAGDEEQPEAGADDKSAGEGAAGEDAAEVPPAADAPLEPPYYPDEDEIEANNGTETGAPGKKRGMSWLPIIIIAAAIAGLLLISLIVLLLRKKRANKNDYSAAPTSEGQGSKSAPT